MTASSLISEKLARNLTRVRSRIESACARVGRDPLGVRLLPVTKTVGATVIEALIDQGIDAIGENRVQSARQKAQYLEAGSHRAHPPKWHLVGHLQQNKVKRAVGFFDLIHSLDSIRLAEALESAGARSRTPVRALVEVNVAAEPQKHGLDSDALLPFLSSLRDSGWAWLQIDGLMTMCPVLEDPEDARPYFRVLREIFYDAKKTCEAETIRMRLLSMGMTQDFEVAIEEGAHVVRVGRALFADLPEDSLDARSCDD